MRGKLGGAMKRDTGSKLGAFGGKNTDGSEVPFLRNDQSPERTAMCKMRRRATPIHKRNF